MPESPLVLLYQAQAHLLQGENQQALEEARLSNQLDMTLLSSYRVLGQAAVLNGEYKEAFTALDTYLQYQKSDAAAWAIYGEALYATNQYSETIQALDTAIKLDPNLPDAFHIKGLAYVELGEGQKGVNEIYRAIRLKPNTFKYQLDFARALFVAERVEEAVGAMYPVERLAANDEELAQVYYWRAVMLEAEGENYLALKDWRKLLDLDEGTIPQEWLDTAEARVAETPTPSSTSTPTPTLTPSPSATRTSPPKATLSPTPGSS
jgi:tetratricopeptide (TPR) repeat protein